MESACTIHEHSPKIFAAILVIIMLSVVDAYLTLHLVDQGAAELNPIMAFYLNQSPLIFFSVKYFLTCASVFMILAIKDRYFWGRRLQGKALFVFFIVILAFVVKWELLLIHFRTP